MRPKHTSFWLVTELQMLFGRSRVNGNSDKMRRRQPAPATTLGSPPSPHLEGNSITINKSKIHFHIFSFARNSIVTLCDGPLAWKPRGPGIRCMRHSQGHRGWSGGARGDVNGKGTAGRYWHPRPNTASVLSRSHWKSGCHRYAPLSPSLCPPRTVSEHRLCVGWSLALESS